jgi:hypothetical protein
MPRTDSDGPRTRKVLAVSVFEEAVRLRLLVDLARCASSTRGDWVLRGLSLSVS